MFINRLNEIDNDLVDSEEWEDQMTQEFTLLETHGKYILNFFSKDNYYCYISSDTLSEPGDLYVHGYLYENDEEPLKYERYFWNNDFMARNVKAVHGNSNHIGYVKANSDAFMFGFDKNGTYGQNIVSLSRLSSLIYSGIKSIYCGPSSTVLITNDNTMLKSRRFDSDEGFGFEDTYDNIWPIEQI